MWTFLRSRKAAAEPSAPESQPAARVDVARLLHQLEWTVLRRLDGQLQGDYRQLLRGNGLEFADLREYQPQDDVRHIDWLATARTQTLYVRTYQEERDMTAWLVVDLSGSVRFGSGERSKHDLALEVCAVLARLLTRRGNPVGLMLHRGGQQGIDRMVPPGSSRRHVLRLLHEMAHAPAVEVSEGTDFGAVLRDVAGRIQRRCTVMVVSDFISAPGWERPLSQLSQRHDLVAIRLRDPIEQALPALGVVPVQDAETHEILWLDSQDAGLRQRFAELAQSREARLHEVWVQAGVDCLEIDTQEPLDTAFLEFIRMRNPRLRARMGGTSG
ncbi:MAG: DUF58 domain-containing protein [Limnohabitans sp.]